MGPIQIGDRIGPTPVTVDVRPLRTRFNGGSCVQTWARDKRLNLLGGARQCG
jgi:hypothetical protein